MTETITDDDIVRKKLTPEDQSFVSEWASNNAQALTELADHFCRFPGDVEISLALKMRSKGDGTYTFTIGDITASREAIRKAFADHEKQKIETKGTLQ